jgi:hypothetical protein
MDRLRRVAQGYPSRVRVFTRRNAMIGWVVARIARRRLERRLNVLAGNRRRRSWLPL